jgi:hypothetical protein
MNRYFLARQARMALAAVLSYSAVNSGAGSAQVVDNPGFTALPRPVNYATPLASTSGVRAVIVYGKLAPWTQKAAEQVQQSIEAWSGAKLELVDDRTVTSEETWLLTDACRRTPLIVLGNAADNRVVHALGTRFLAQSSRCWPGGDRYTIRSVLEPFVADVNFIALEASTEAGLNGAVAKFAELLKTFPKDAAATIPLTRVIDGVKDQWGASADSWKPPKEWFPSLDGSATELAKAFKGPAIAAGDSLAKAGYGNVSIHMLGGWAGGVGAPTRVELDEPTQRATAAMFLQGCRAAGGRTHIPLDHYGAMSSILGMRGLFQAGILSEQELNEFENALTLSGACPNEYWYDLIGAGDKWVNEVGNRHTAACLLVTVNTLDYVANHCRMDETTSKEINRRLEGTRKTLAFYRGSFRDNCDTWELGESTMMEFYAQLHQGMLDNIRNGALKRMADMYVLTTDNMIVPNQWHIPGCYAGLDAYIGASPGMMVAYWHGESLISAAAFYYDEPQWRWFMKRDPLGGPWGSVATPPMTMHWDNAGSTALPSRYLGVVALPYDPRLYELNLHRNPENPWGLPKPFLAPGPLEKSVDRVAFRDGMDPKDAYLFVATSQAHNTPLQNNSIAKYTDLGEVWLYHNTMRNTTWGRNVVSISNGQSYRPRAGCTLEAIANLGEISAVATKETDVAGANYTRTIVHWRGHYFVVLDRIEAATASDFNMVCRWRSPQPAALRDHVWVADAPSGNSFCIQNTEPLLQTAEFWEADGSGRPRVLSQFKGAKLAPGQAATFQNLLYAAGPQRPDEFRAKRVDATSLLAKGKTAAGEHLALIGTGGHMPLDDFETDAAIYDVAGETISLAGVRTLRVKVKGKMTDVLRSSKPVNVTLDCRTGTAQVVAADPAASADAAELSAGVAATVAGLRKSGALPTTSAALAKLWERTRDAAAGGPGAPHGDKGFRAIAADTPLRLPMQPLTRVDVSANVPAGQPLCQLTDGMYFGVLPGYTPTWPSNSTLAITLTFPESTEVSCLRPVGILEMRPAYGFGSDGFGRPYYHEHDFTFSLVLSDDGFTNDVRTIDHPKVSFEETAFYPSFHSALGRLPTWRIDVNPPSAGSSGPGKAKQIRLLPRATTAERSALHLVELEAYGVQPARDLTARAFAVDIDGDGANELIVGTGNKELAAYGADGKQRWRKQFAGDIFTMACDDLDDDGKAEALVYLTTEQLHRVNGDGTERPIADVCKAQMDIDKACRAGGVLAMAAWKPVKTAEKEVVLWSEGCFRVAPDGAVRYGKIPMSRGAGRLVNLYPNEPEVLATVGYGVTLWSARCDANGGYVQLGSKPLTGAGGAPFMRGMGWVQPVDRPGFKGLLAANDGGVNWYPIEAFVPGSSTNGWGFSAGGVPVTAALAEDLTGDGVPEVFLGREDGFVNVFALDGGKALAMLNAGGPVLGLAMLKDRKDRAGLAVGTKFGVQLFDGEFKRIGARAMPAAAFAGPGGKGKDRVYVVDAAGHVTVLVLK